MIPLFNKLINRYLKYRYKKIESFKLHPHETQAQVIGKILDLNQDCAYAKQFRLSSGQSLPSHLPPATYEDLKPSIDKMLLGQSDVLMIGQAKWFAKSSGTSSGVSKYIPVSNHHLKYGHYTSSWDVVTVLYNDDDVPPIFAYKNMLIGGSISPYSDYPESMVGDISGILVHNFPKVGRPFYTPSFKEALTPDWEEKIHKLVTICSDEPVITFAGVPTWISIILKGMLEHTGKETMREVWPNAAYYLHGGVNFEPYRSTFESYFPDGGVRYMEAYNASEGYFAFQDDKYIDGMLLLLDNDIYYEFIHYSEYESHDRKILTLAEVQVGEKYVILITSSAGLWRYVLGDVVTFVQTQPYRIKVVGRISQYINAYGEEVMVHNTDQAITDTCRQHNCRINDYTACPIFPSTDHKPGHEWYVEFDQAPTDITIFSNTLDRRLQSLNSDYAAKRYKDLAMGPLKLSAVPKGTFNYWLKAKGRQGGQVKVPRLSMDRTIIEDIKKMGLVTKNGKYSS